MFNFLNKDRLLSIVQSIKTAHDNNRSLQKNIDLVDISVRGLHSHIDKYKHETRDELRLIKEAVEQMKGLLIIHAERIDSIAKYLKIEYVSKTEVTKGYQKTK